VSRILISKMVISFDTKVSGSLKDLSSFMKAVRRRLMKPVIRGHKKTAQEFIRDATINYLQKRIKKTFPSNIINSFTYETKIANIYEIITAVSVGDKTCPYIIYVEDIGWRLKIGRKEAYHFFRETTLEKRSSFFENVKEELLTTI